MNIDDLTIYTSLTNWGLVLYSRQEVIFLEMF